MYFVIKKILSKPIPEVVGFEVLKYIATKGSTNVIFEFKKDDKIIRKWIDKNEIILLTADKEFFLKTLANFKKIESEQLSFLQQAKDRFDATIKQTQAVIEKNIEEFNKLRQSDDVPCVLKTL